MYFAITKYRKGASTTYLKDSILFSLMKSKTLLIWRVKRPHTVYIYVCRFIYMFIHVVEYRHFVFYDM